MIASPQFRVNDANGPNQNGGDLDDDFYNWLPPPQEAWHLIPHYTCTAAVLETADPNTSYLFTAYNDKSWRDYTDPNDPAFSTEFTIGYGASQNLTCGTGWSHDLVRSKDGYWVAGSMPPPQPDARWLQEQTDVKSAVGGNGYIYVVGVNHGIGNDNDAVFLARSRDGITWDPNDVFTVVSDDDPLIEYRTPYVAAGGPRGYENNVYVVYVQDRRIVGGQYNDGRARTILFVESRDAGATFSEPQVISAEYIEIETSQFISTLPVCAAAVGPRPTGEVYVTWYAPPPGDPQERGIGACEEPPVPVVPDTFEVRRFEPKIPGQAGEGTWYPDRSGSPSSTVITEFVPLWRSNFAPDLNPWVSNLMPSYEQPAIAVDHHPFRKGWVYFVYATEDALRVSDPNDLCVGDVNIGFARLRPGVSGAWEAKPPTGAPPSGRLEHIFVYDGLRGKVVMFGGSQTPYGPGTNETKLWNGFFWESGPSGGSFARSSHAGAYAANRDRLVVFGGRDPFDNNRPSDKTYEFTGSAWVQVIPATTWPSARENHAMVYDETDADPNQHVVLLFGGRSGEAAPYTYNGDTWTWDGTDWTLRATTGPSARWKHAMAYDRQRKRVLLFGGENAAGQALGDTWEWDGTSWTEVQTPGPSARTEHAMAYDDTWKRMVLFGGREQNGAIKGDTWFWLKVGEGHAWVQHQPSQGEQLPSLRYGHAMAFSGRVGVVLFGGLDDTDPNQPVLYNDVWEWQTSRWEVSESPINDPQEPLPPTSLEPWERWRFGATSQFMPAMAMSRAGHLGVSWLDRRDDVYDINATPEDEIMNQSYRCYFAWSADGGKTWQGSSPGSEDFDVSRVSVDPRADTEHPLVYWWLDRLVDLGGYRGMGAWGRKFFPVWVDLTDWPRQEYPHDHEFAYQPPVPPEPEKIQQLGDIYGALVEVVEPVPPDYEPDCDVDLADFLVFQLCFGGSNNPPAPSCPPGMDADYDDDGDVDMADYLMFEGAFTGSGVNPCDDDVCPMGGEEEGESRMGPTFFPEPIPDELYWRLYEYCRHNGIPFS